jgi:hypothetical protein
MPTPSTVLAKQAKRVSQRAERKPAHEVRRHCLRVLVNDREKATLQVQARMARRSVGRYLREVGQGYVLKSAVDMEAVLELARTNADLERLGRLLNMWLTKHPGTAHFNKDTIEALLKRIEAQQEALGEVMRALVRPRTER